MLIDGKRLHAAFVGPVINLRNVLEAVGIAFSFLIERGEVVPAAVTYSPPDRREGH